MFWSQKSLQVVAFLGIACFAFLVASENTENERSVAEHQLMNDKGQSIAERNRIRWLQSLLENVQSPGRREVPLLINSHREAREINYMKQPRDKLIRNMRNLQYKDTFIARNKKMIE